MAGLLTVPLVARSGDRPQQARIELLRRYGDAKGQSRNKVTTQAGSENGLRCGAELQAFGIFVATQASVAVDQVSRVAFLAQGLGGVVVGFEWDDLVDELQVVDELQDWALLYHPSGIAQTRRTRRSNSPPGTCGNYSACHCEEAFFADEAIGIAAIPAFSARRLRQSRLRQSEIASPKTLAMTRRLSSYHVREKPGFCRLNRVDRRFLSILEHPLVRVRFDKRQRFMIDSVGLSRAVFYDASQAPCAIVILYFMESGYA